MKTREFTATIGGELVELEVRTPSAKDEKEGSKVYNGAFTDALKSKAVVRARLDDLLVDQGLWDDSKQMKFEMLQKSLLDSERTLAKGGISLSKAKEVAMKMREDRADLRDLISVKTNLDQHTAEGQADNAKFNYLVSACTFYKGTDKKVFSSHEDYINRQTDLVSLQAANNLANMIYGLDSDYEYKLPENEFLTEYNFVDDKLRLLDEKGRLVDVKGRLIDEEGRFINEDGEFVDKFGNVVDELGEYKVDFSPFLDDDGKPVVLSKDSEKPEEKTEPKKAKKKSASKTTSENDEEA